jgi:LAO/AO transport system kinase
MSLVDDLLGGNRRALARAITEVENGSPESSAILSTLFPHTGQAHLIGVTGAPGTGKSSLVNQMALAFRERSKTVGIVAVDPTSPFSGGAILGDRIRMRDLHGDSGVFIRSMATRGSLGGLARATTNVVSVLDAAGFDVVLIETVGAGQSEVDIARRAHTVIVVEAPGLGDDVQAIKAGILEIADILVVNKADDPRAEKTASALSMMLKLGHPAQRTQMLHHGKLMAIAVPADQSDAPMWDIPIVLTNAISGEGVSEVLDAVIEHRDFLQETGELALRDQARLASQLEAELQDKLLEKLLEETTDDVARLVAAVSKREMTPQSALDRLLQNHVSIDALSREEKLV